MNKSRVWTIVGCCGVALTALAWGQSQRKAGLWEVTSQINMAGMPQMPQLPPGTQLPPHKHTGEVHAFTLASEFQQRR